MSMLGIYARTSRESSGEHSTIEQQVRAGIKFAISHNFEYKVFQDKGISGYKIVDNEDVDPFANRPAFSELIEDIRLGNIDKIWIWEHSRLSRNQYASAYISNILIKYNVIVYEKDKEYNLNDPNTQLVRGMLDVIAQYERQLIVGRTTRGLHNAINKGNRCHAKFFGYKRVGINNEKKTVWQPVESELTQIRNWYEKYKNGESLRSIVLSEFKKSNNKEEVIMRSTKLGRFLKHYEYTSFVLTTEGLEYLHKFDKDEINNIQMLRNPDYWVKSKIYTEKIITIDEWVDIRERIQANRIRRKKCTHRNAEKSLGTGLITCGDCGTKYFYHNQRYKTRKGTYTDNLYYFHHKTFTTVCNQKPKSLSLANIDMMLKIFVLYVSIMSDENTKIMKDLIQQKEIEKKATVEKLKIIKRNKTKIEKQINKYKTALETTDDVGTITIIAKQIEKSENELQNISEEIVNTTLELEIKNDELTRTKTQQQYYSIRDVLKNFYENWETEQQRNYLLTIVDSIIINGTELKIISGGFTFIFNTKTKYSFHTEIYHTVMNEQNKDIDYFANFRERDNQSLYEAMYFVLFYSELNKFIKWKEKEKQIIVLK